MMHQDQLDFEAARAEKPAIELVPVRELALVLELARVPELGKMKGQQQRAVETHGREQTDESGALTANGMDAVGSADCLSGNTKPENYQGVAKCQEGRCLQAEKLTCSQARMTRLDPASELVVVAAAAEDAGEKTKHGSGEMGEPYARIGK